MRKEHWLYIGFGIILALLVFTFVYDDDSLWGPCRGWGRDTQERHHGMHHRGDEYFGIGFYGFGLLFWILVVFFIVLVFFNSRTKKEEALDILDKRYARGDLSQEEYTRMKEELSK